MAESTCGSCCVGGVFGKNGTVPGGFCWLRRPICAMSADKPRAALVGVRESMEGLPFGARKGQSEPLVAVR